MVKLKKGEILTARRQFSTDRKVVVVPASFGSLFITVTGLAFFLTVYGLVSNQLTQKMIKEMRQSTETMLERQGQVLDKITQVLDHHGQMLERINQTTERANQTLKRASQTLERVSESAERVAQISERVAFLVV